MFSTVGRKSHRSSTPIRGVQFTLRDFVARLKTEEIKRNQAGLVEGRCYDNILVERLWRTVKY